ncbi:hypothetical protein HWI79_2967 [Cryptosporidium felis]|nr:hypothetical protein HWI79_2967 [Cryptosporidium felis]
MSGYSGLSIGIEGEKRVAISQANPVQLSRILSRLRYKAFSELSSMIYSHQSDYQYQYKYYLAKLSRYETLEHSVTIKLCSIMPEARYRINCGSSTILQNYSDEEIYYSQYQIPQDIFIHEVPIFREYTTFLSLRRSLLDSRKKIWRLYSIIETKSKVLRLWESEYQEAIKEVAENEYIYNLTTNNSGRSVKDYAERLKQIRLSESKKVKEMIVLNRLENENENNEELEGKYSDDDTHKKQRECCPTLFLDKRRVRLNRSSKSESPNPAHGDKKSEGRKTAGGRSKNSGTEDISSLIPDSREVKKELNRLPPRPED